MLKRCFELIGGGHRKFWTVEVVGRNYLCTFGRIGTKGQTQVKTFDYNEAAESYARKMIREKLDKGYMETAKTAHPGAAGDLIKRLRPDELDGMADLVKEAGL